MLVSILVKLHLYLRTVKIGESTWVQSQVQILSRHGQVCYQGLWLCVG